MTYNKLTDSEKTAYEVVGDMLNDPEYQYNETAGSIREAVENVNRDFDADAYGNGGKLKLREWADKAAKDYKTASEKLNKTLKEYEQENKRTAGEYVSQEQKQREKEEQRRAAATRKLLHRLNP